MRSILEAVLEHAAARPDEICFHLVSTRNPESNRTWRQVVQQAERAAAFLQIKGVKRGEIVVLVGTHHADFVACWLGAVWLGAVPTVLAEPSVRVNREIYWSRLQALLERIDARVLLTAPTVEAGVHPRSSYVEAVGFEGPAVARVTAAPTDLLLLQHSSGTTGLQKGVMLSHGAVMAHAESYGRALDLASGDRIATWLPLYHDMGLIACFVTPLITGVPVVWLSPFEWIAQPASLIAAIHRFRASHVWLPNFAFEFLAQRVKDPQGAFDLSCVKAIVNCSEPVTAGAMDAFASHFKPNGLNPAALHACYAMAENVFAVTTSSQRVPSRRRRVLKAKWNAEHRAEEATDAAAPDEIALHLSNGQVVDGCEVRIAATEGNASLPAAHAGRVLIRSTFLFDGYFRREDLNAQLIDADGFYDTGDLGYLDEAGHLFVTGRVKDLVIIGGRNVYPHDVEAVVSEVEGVRAGRVVVFGAPHSGLGTEGLVALVETDREESEWKGLERAVRAAVPSRLDMDLLDVRVVPKGELRKSTSGKLARGGNRDWYLAGRFGSIPPNVGGGGK